MFQLQCLLDYKYSFNVNVNVCLILFSFQVKWVDSQKKKRKNLKLLFWSKIFRKQKKLHKKGILLHLLVKCFCFYLIFQFWYDVDC